LVEQKKQYPLGKKYDTIVSLCSENGVKVVKLVRDFNIPSRKLTTSYNLKK